MSEARLSDWTLVEIIDGAMAPTGRYTNETIKAYRRACRRYEKFRGSMQRPCEVTMRLVELFRDWQLEQGIKDDQATKYCEILAAVVRFADEDLLPRTCHRTLWLAAGEAGTIERIMQEEYFPSNTRIVAADTERLYAMAVLNFSKFLGRPATLNDLTDKTVGGWIRSLREGHLSVASINGMMSKVKAFWSWAARRRMVEHFPTLVALPAPRKIPKSWTQAEMQQLVNAIDKMERQIATVPITKWFRAFILVAFDTGERTAAMLALKWSHYNRGTGELESLAEDRKGGRKAMLYKLKPATMAALEEIRRDRPLIFQWEGHLGTFYAHYKRLLSLAGLPYEKNKSGPQKIRRTFASHIEAAGGNATAALDHTSRKTTVESYLDPRVIQAPSPNAILFDLATN